MAQPRNSLSLPDHLVQLLSAADRARGFPAGTMAALMQQESGGRPDIWANPSTPHYPSGVTDKGVKSSAFGPFGILESTARDPGYGVTPLKDKSLEEQLRFAADYLDARAKSAGSLSAGLAGYGEGERYSRQVERRRDGIQTAEAAAPAAPPAQSEVMQPMEPLAQVGAAPLPEIPMDYWGNFLRNTAARPVEAPAQPVAAAPAAVPAPASLHPAEIAAIYDIPLNTRPSFGMFQGLARLGRKAA